MIVRSLDPIGDWTYGRGRNDYKKNLDAISQSISTRLKSFLGDCFFDQSAGIDWFNLLGSKRELELKLSISSVLLNTQGVTGINETLVTKSNSTRIFLVQYSVETIYGRVSGSISQEV